MHVTELISGKKGFLSIEVCPPRNDDEWDKFERSMEELATLAPQFVSVTYGAGGISQRNTLKVCEIVRKKWRLPVVPHYTTVGTRRDDADRFLARMAELGIDSMLALRGDRPRGLEPDAPWPGEFLHASNLAEYIRQAAPQVEIGVAGYPEAHPDSKSIAGDIQVMRSKQDAGARFIMTQLFFDNRVYFDYVARLRSVGVHAPVIPNVLPIRSFQSLRRVMSLCNARIPGKLYHRMEEADQRGGVEAVRREGMCFAREQIQDLLRGGAPGIHLNTFNSPVMCRELAQCAREALL